MAGFCPAPAPDAGFVQGLLGSVDCNVQAMSQAAYGAVAQGSSPVSAALTAMLTLYIAVMGLRMLAGRAPRIGELTVSALKIGVVLALATSWPTYQQLVFDTLFKGPEQLATNMLAVLAPPDSGAATPFDGLQLAHDQLQAGAAWFNQHSVTSVSPLQGGAAGAAFSLNASALLMLVSTLGTVLAAKIALGLLLGLGPVFVALLLFDATRGVFEGWLRASLAFALTPLLATLALVVELTLISGPLAELADLRSQGLVETAPATAVFLLTLVCTVVTAGLAIAGGMIASGVRLRWGGATALSPAQAASAAQGSPGQAGSVAPPARAGSEPPPRANVIAAAAAAMERRDSRMLVEGGVAAPRTSIAPRRDERPLSPVAQPFGQSYRRAAQPRRAASNVRRDR